MKQLFFITVCVFLQIAVQAQVSFGKSEKIDKDWKFSLSDAKGASDLSFDSKSWENINLPHDWSVKGSLSPDRASCTGFLPGGIAWYRKVLTIPEEKAEEKVYLYFEGVYNRSEVFINGHSLGKRPNGYISFMYDATPFVQFGKENLIAVRVDHSRAADSRWYTGSGIYRDVWLVYANEKHIAQWGVFAYPKMANDKMAEVAIEVEVENHTNLNSGLLVRNELFDPAGKLVGKSENKLLLQNSRSGKVYTSIKVNKPQLWNLNNPVLYTLQTRVFEKNKLIDEASTKTGIRTYTFDPNKGFALNGNWMKMKGVCLHHDAGVLGATSYKQVWKRRLQTLKELGVNAIRTSHNPQASHLYELCDELGLLVMNEAFDEWEFPKRKWLIGWNHGTPGFEGSYDFFEEWGEKDLADMVRRDRNHVSIFAFSIGNEVDYPNDPYSHPVLDGGRETGFTQPIFGGYKNDAPDAMRLGAIAKRLAAVVRTYDPSRAVTAGLAGVAMSNETEYPGALDIAGYNYTENRYLTDHAKYPNRVIYGSENRHDYSAWKAVLDNEHIFGQFLWTGIDYLGESGQWPSRGFYSGLLDFGGFIKPRGYYRQSLWSAKPMAYIGTYHSPLSGGSSDMNDVWSQLEAKKGKRNQDAKPSMDAWPIWNYDHGQQIRVVCYTNAAEAKLLLNNTEVGARKGPDATTQIIYWDIPYAEGTLEVIGFDKQGVQVVRNSIQSSGRPFALTTNAGTIKVNKNGIAQIAIEVVDENGVKVQLADNEVTCRISGRATLLGLEGSDNNDMGDYTDNKQRVYHGRLLAYIQVGEGASEIKVRFSSPLLKSLDATILVE